MLLLAYIPLFLCLEGGTYLAWKWKVEKPLRKKAAILSAKLSQEHW